ncbi:Uncharacterised protein [Mycobacteroides abscessus subsp. massiliense]|uniref:hypothetical protein n=2 Tax=Mycobacteriaceae TaxID=1762 RepID=UPI0009D4995E|nr:hypothetical protein [Mycobacteroides abscessus]MDO3208690.1 hypothetical protein [Mycobacteroides abscessus subsp. massiliense]SKF40020.1 Uncharacterised protein [Mycobacteroides abscessus subsp. massiliense]SKR74262.1 Uncharacterised protein [Mycobacteroides abscessus subsp. massiliense]SKT51172.1 Uncharacterised protein [Mycobacteroides abscessus subsp. massiliense]
MLLAVAVWRQHPTEIEDLFLDKGLDIGDWHRGLISSRRLLVICRHAPEDGPYKTALRDGDYPEWVQMLKEIHKEIALYRASKYVGGDHEYIPQVFLSLPERIEHFGREAAEAEFIEEAREGLLSDLF